LTATNRDVVLELIKELEELIDKQKQSDQKPPVNVENPPPPPPPPLEERSWYEDKIGWGLVGAGLVAAGGGVAFLAHASRQPGEGQTRREQEQALDLNDSARSSRTIGGVLAGVGAAIVVGGVVKMVLYDRPGTRVAVVPGGIIVAGRF